MSSPSLPPYKAVCESAEEAQRLADNAARVFASLQVGAHNNWLSMALTNERMSVAVVHLQGYLGQRALLERTAALRVRVAELEQQLGAARPAQPATASGDEGGGRGGPHRDDGAGGADGADASGVGA
ncbi:hypothetical protein KCU71_g570, partial [Aureobasidium melanogenum]